LLPWKKVIDNVGLGLTGNWRERALEALAAVGLSDKADQWPATLSGGQKQRVALARALIHQPHLLLLDEPLGALDALTRIEMQQLIEKLWRQHGFTVLLVTHDVAEAVAVADRVILIEQGRIGLDLTVDVARPARRTDRVLPAEQARMGLGLALEVASLRSHGSYRLAGPKSGELEGVQPLPANPDRPENITPLPPPLRWAP